MRMGKRSWRRMLSRMLSGRLSSSRDFAMWSISIDVSSLSRKRSERILHAFFSASVKGADFMISERQVFAKKIVDDYALEKCMN